MFISRYKLNACVVVAACLLQLSCMRKWDDHNQPNDPDITQNLYDKIAADASLSMFAGYLKETGYADTLMLSKTFTVWAPTNDALKPVDAAITADNATLKKFVAHHIALLSYYSNQTTGTGLRIPLLDGKYGIFRDPGFDNATLASKDRIAGNGVLHSISSAAAPVGNCWNYIDSLKAGNDMAAYLKGLTYDYFDSTKAVQTGIDPNTGKPIYQPGTGVVSRNAFIDGVYNIGNESKQYTVFVLTNSTWDSERAKLDTFYKTSSTDSSKAYARWFAVKDLVVEGAYAPDQLPDSLLSKFGVWVPVKKSAIQHSYRTSNGYVYVMNDMNITLQHRIPPVVIEGESPSGTSGSWSPVFYRTLINPNKNQPFRDLFVYNHGVNKYYVRYRLLNTLTTKYKVYWATYNNRFNNTLNQRLAIGSPTATTFPYRNVAYNVYNEEYLGDFTVTTFGNGVLDLYLVSADIAPSSSNQNQNAMFLDYIRLEPVLQ